MSQTEAETINGARLLVRLLRRHGIESIFGLSGNGVLGIFDAALDEGLLIIDTRDENGAIKASGARALVTRTPQACLVTEGPGFANALGGIAAMNYDGIPVVIFTNSEADDMVGTGAFQEMNGDEMAVPVSKWSTKVRDIRHLPDVVARAFRVAGEGVPGAVVVTVANQVLLGSIDPASLDLRTPALARPTSPAAPSSDFTADALAALRAAERPLLIVGPAARWDRADAALRAFAERTGIPTGTTDLARGLLSDEHPCSFGPGRPGPAFLDADTVLVLGERLDYILGWGRWWKPGTRIIHVYPDAAEVGRSIDCEFSSTANCRLVLEAMLAAMGDAPWPQRGRADGARAAYLATLERQRAVEAENGDGIHPGIVAAAVDRFVADDGILVLDGANCANWAKIFVPVRDADRYIEWGRLGMIGMGLPYAIGAKVARPDRPVALIVGDGSLGFHFMEFESALRHGIPVVVVVCNDSAWGIEQHFQQGIFGRLTGTALSHVRYEKMVEALGGFGAYVDRLADLEPALAAAFAAGRPALVNVRIQGVPDPVTSRATGMLRKKHGR